MFTQTFDNFSARYQVDVVNDFQQVSENVKLCVLTLKLENAKNLHFVDF